MADLDNPQGLSRRTALKAGAVGGAALWTVPLAQIVGTGIAEATSAPTPPPGGGGGEPPSSGVASFGLVVFRLGGQLFAFQVTESGSLADPGNATLRYLQTQGFDAAKGGAEAVGQFTTGRTGDTLFATRVGSVEVVAAYTHDGSFGTPGGGFASQFRPVSPSGSTYFFIK